MGAGGVCVSGECEGGRGWWAAFAPGVPRALHQGSVRVSGVWFFEEVSSLKVCTSTVQVSMRDCTSTYSSTGLVSSGQDLYFAKYRRRSDSQNSLIALIVRIH